VAANFRQQSLFDWFCVNQYQESVFFFVRGLVRQSFFRLF